MMSLHNLPILYTIDSSLTELDMKQFDYNYKKIRVFWMVPDFDLKLTSIHHSAHGIENGGRT